MRNVLCALLASSLLIPVRSGAQMSSSAGLYERSEGDALAFSLGATLIPIGIAAMNPKGVLPGVLLFSGLWAGPSTGYWYAGSSKWKKGFITRSIAFGVGGAGVAALTRNCGLFGNEKGECGMGFLLGLAASAVVVVSDIADLGDVKGAVREMRGQAPRVALMPAIPLDGRSVGFAVRVAF